jgi:hypothetical protein
MDQNNGILFQILQVAPMASFSDCRKFSNFFGPVGRMVDRIVAVWRQAMSPDRYRPEKHYMRGRGPTNSDNKNSAAKNSAAETRPKNSSASGGNSKIS